MKTPAICIAGIHSDFGKNTAWLGLTSGLKKEAIEDFRKALLIDPTLSGAKSGLKRLKADTKIAAETKELVNEGQVLAEKNCAWCHAIGRKDKSAHKKAPAFRMIHKRHPILSLRDPLSRTIAYPHDVMPKFKLTNSEIDRIIAYINSLSSGK